MLFSLGTDPLSGTNVKDERLGVFLRTEFADSIPLRSRSTVAKTFGLFL